MSATTHYICVRENMKREIEDLEYGRSIRTVVISDMLSRDDEIGWIKAIAEKGCITGLAPNMMADHDISYFFSHHYNEIEQLRFEYEHRIGRPFAIRGDLKKCLSWFAYQETARQIRKELGISY